MDPRKCQTTTASPAEPGELPIWLGGRRDTPISSEMVRLKISLFFAFEAKWRFCAVERHRSRLPRHFWQNLLGRPSHQKEPNMGDE